MSLVGRMSKNLTRQSGVGLIEVLISMLILAVGILGMASLQLTAKRTSYEAVQRSIATSLGRSMIERMRANPNALDSYVVDDFAGASTPATNCSTADCSTAAEMATYDLWEWGQELDGASETITQGAVVSNTGGLLSPRACITNAAGVVQVAIVWQGHAEVGNPTASACGEGLGLYGTGESKRQLVLLSSYIEGF